MNYTFLALLSVLAHQCQNCWSQYLHQYSEFGGCSWCIRERGARLQGHGEKGYKAMVKKSCRGSLVKKLLPTKYLRRSRTIFSLNLANKWTNKQTGTKLKVLHYQPAKTSRLQWAYRRDQTYGVPILPVYFKTKNQSPSQAQKTKPGQRTSDSDNSSDTETPRQSKLQDNQPVNQSDWVTTRDKWHGHPQQSTQLRLEALKRLPFYFRGQPKEVYKNNKTWNVQPFPSPSFREALEVMSNWFTSAKSFKQSLRNQGQAQPPGKSRIVLMPGMSRYLILVEPWIFHSLGYWLLVYGMDQKFNATR